MRPVATTHAFRQPSGPGSIDRNHPIARSLVFAIHFGQSAMIDVVKEPGVQADTGTLTRAGMVGRMGIPLSGIYGSGTAARSVASASNMLFTTGSVTHMGLVRLTAIENPFGAIFAISDGTSNTCFSFSRNNTGTDMTVSRGNNFSAPTGGTTATTLANGEVHLWTVTSTGALGGTNVVWIDRTKFTTTLSGSSTTLPTVSTARFLTARNLSRFATGMYFLHYCWNRILFDWEILALESNPWQLFIDETAPLWFLSEIAAATNDSIMDPIIFGSAF